MADTHKETALRMNRVIIVGGSGLIGRALANDLSKSGYEVIVLSRSPASVRGLPDGVRAERWDGSTADGWGNLINGAAAIVNLAGESIGIPPIPWWLPGRREKIRTSRVNAGRAVIQAIESASKKPRVVIQASGINYYGLCGDRIVTEKDSAGNDFAARVCMDWEESTAQAELLGVRRVLIRTAPVLARESGILIWLALPFRMFVGGPLGNGTQWFSWIHIADQIAAIRFSIENENARGIFNLSSPNPLTNADFGYALGRALGRPYWFPTPAFAMRLIFGELGRVMVLGSQRVLPQRLQEAGFNFRFPEAEAALRDLFVTTSGSVSKTDK
jgi:uncharacterized protein (TIGR01777 family)